MIFKTNLSKSINESFIKNRFFNVIIINILIILVACLIYWHIKSDVFLINLICLMTILLLVSLVNIFLFTNGIKNETERKELAVYKRYLPVVEDLMCEIRRKQHDYDNHLQSIDMYLNLINSDENEVFRRYIQDIKIKQGVTQLSKLENKMVAGLIYSKKCDFEVKELSLGVNISNFFINTNLKDFEIVEIIGVLLDYAEEASVKNTETILNINVKDTMNQIEVLYEHQFISAETFNFMFSQGYTTKEGIKRDYGLYNVASILKKYNGKYIVGNTIIGDKNYVVIQLLFH